MSGTLAGSSPWLMHNVYMGWPVDREVLHPSFFLIMAHNLILFPFSASLEAYLHAPLYWLDLLLDLDRASLLFHFPILFCVFSGPTFSFFDYRFACGARPLTSHAFPAIKCHLLSPACACHDQQLTVVGCCQGLPRLRVCRVHALLMIVRIFLRNRISLRPRRRRRHFRDSVRLLLSCFSVLVRPHVFRYRCRFWSWVSCLTCAVQGLS
ncbi:hypothetical protein BDQ17DRAFT_211138 [Cyathus striatus]|nr:hypothetical protein BDQ17DRAFT_211138 [Cyathus striatus]